MVEGEKEQEEQEVTYNGFVTPCLICEGSDTKDRGHIIDPYAKVEGQDGLLCGEWSRGFQDGLIHLYLIKPVAAIINERFGWVNKKTLLKKPISYMQPTGAEIETPALKQKNTPSPKKKVVFDPITKQFHLEM